MIFRLLICLIFIEIIELYFFSWLYSTHLIKEGLILSFFLFFMILCGTTSLGISIFKESIKDNFFNNMAKTNVSNWSREKTSDFFLLLICSILLIIPGYITNTLGLILYSPMIRTILIPKINIKEFIHASSLINKIFSKSISFTYFKDISDSRCYQKNEKIIDINKEN